MTDAVLPLQRIEAARTRIAPLLRRTPVIAAQPARHPAIAVPLMLKLESLQVTGSFKPRGALAKATAMAAGTRGLITASGGNHGLGVAYAAHCLGLRAVVYLPESAPPAKAEKLRAWGADVRIHGSVWDESNVAALSAADAEDLAYIHAFADPDVLAGQGTLGLEILEDAPGIDTLVVAIGGGGLIAGVASAAKALRPDLRIIGVEPVGAPTHHASRAAGKLVTLERVETMAGTLAPRRSEPINFAIINDLVDEIVLVTDDDMRNAARWLFGEFGVGTELSGAAALAALATGKAAGERPLAIVCGAGTDGCA
jgi:threonine dehydratase